MACVPLPYTECTCHMAPSMPCTLHLPYRSVRWYLWSVVQQVKRLHNLWWNHLSKQARRILHCHPEVQRNVMHSTVEKWQLYTQPACPSMYVGEQAYVSRAQEHLQAFSDGVYSFCSGLCWNEEFSQEFLAYSISLGRSICCSWTCIHCSEQSGKITHMPRLFEFQGNGSKIYQC